MKYPLQKRTGAHKQARWMHCSLQLMEIARSRKTGKGGVQIAAEYCAKRMKPLNSLNKFWMYILYAISCCGNTRVQVKSFICHDYDWMQTLILNVKLKVVRT